MAEAPWLSDDLEAPLIDAVWRTIRGRLSEGGVVRWVELVDEVARSTGAQLTTVENVLYMARRGGHVRCSRGNPRSKKAPREVWLS